MIEAKEQINFKLTEECIIIKIPVSLLKQVAERNPENPLIVLNAKELADKVMFELEYNLGSVESGLTGFQELLDTAIIEVATNGEDCVEFASTDPY